MSVPEKSLQTVEGQVITEYVPSVAVTLDQAKDNFRRLQQVTRELMRKGVDYDVIPGTPKPTLLKPGAEHLLQFFGLGHKVTRIEAKEDFDNGFFYYCYRVTIFKARPMPDGAVYEQIIAECEGSANSKEKRYRNQDVYTIVNTLQKMAIKRALVGATLQATGTSGMFTQDLDDAPELANNTPEAQASGSTKSVQSSAPQAQGEEKHPTDKQLKRLYAITKAAGVPIEDMKAYIKETFGKDHSSELTIAEYNQLCEMLEAKATPDAEEEN